MLSVTQVAGVIVAILQRIDVAGAAGLCPQFAYMFWYGFRSCTLPDSVNHDQRVVPARPRRVVITMTPFEASVPYSVAADGPFTISTFSISSGERAFRLETDEFAMLLLFEL